LESPSHFYRAAGTYTVTLIASVGNKCTATTARTIYVGNVSPFFTNAPDTVCNNTAIQFSGGANPTPSYVKWIFGDNNAVRNHSPVQHSFALPGDHTISLVAYNQQGCSDTITKPIHIKAGAGLEPFFITAPDTVCAGSATQFAGSAKPAPTSIGWFFSDNGAFQSSSPTQHIFATPNDYKVSLIAYNSEGCSDTITKSVRVKAGPVSSFAPLKTAGCVVPFTVKFDNTSAGGEIWHIPGILETAHPLS
jgi:PKD repeat protein